MKSLSQIIQGVYIRKNGVKSISISLRVGITGNDLASNVFIRRIAWQLSFVVIANFAASKTCVKRIAVIVEREYQSKVTGRKQE